MTDRFGRLRALLAAALITTAAAAATVSLASAQEPASVAPTTFSDAGSSCTFLSLGDVPAELPLCSVTNTPADRTTTFAPLLNAANALVGTGTLESDAFTAPSDLGGGAALTIDRQVTIDAPIDVGSRVEWIVALVSQEEGSTPIEVIRDEVTTSDAAQVRRTVRLDPDQLEAGGSYKLRVTSRFTTQTAQLLDGSMTTAFDDVALATIPTPVGPAGKDGADGSRGADGADGQDGSDGTNGTNGTNGKDGTDGTTGATGATGAAGAQGVTGEPGTPGTQGAPGTPGTTTTVVQSLAAPVRVNSREARRLLRLDRLTRVQFKGPFANQLRLKVFCRTAVLSRCEGTVKLRTVKPINVALKKGRKRMKKVTLGTGSYQLTKRQIGYSKVFLTPLGRRLVKARAPIAVNALVTVLDQQGRQQRLSRRFSVKLG